MSFTKVQDPGKSQVQWYTSVIPVFKRLRQENCFLLPTRIEHHDLPNTSEEILSSWLGCIQ